MKLPLLISVVFASLNIVWCQTNVVSKNNTKCIIPECNCCIESALCVRDSCNGQCKDGYHGGRCRNNCPKNCIMCRDADNPLGNSSLLGVSNCTECKPGYFSTTEFYQCQFNCSSPCQTCMSETVCISCVHGYYLSGTTCYQCIQECTACLSQTICNSCKDGYYLSGTTCRECRQECTTCSSPTLCNSCKDGYYLSGTTCTECRQECTTCSSPTLCNSCKDGYYFLGTTCTECRQECTRCSSPTLCNSCKDGYFLSRTICIECPAECKTCLSKTICTTCQDGHFLSENTCQRCQVPCVACLSGITCTSCRDGYYLSGTICLACEAECSKCLSATTCSSCQDGFFISGTRCFRCQEECRTCISEITCSSCITEYVLSDGVCLLCPRGCEVCSSQIQCEQCKVGYYPSEGVCFSCPNSCVSCTSFDRCTSCKIGYDLTSGQCILCPLSCISCTSKSHCTECQDGYYLTDGFNNAVICRRCSLGCTAGKCNIVSGICQCKATFTRDKCDRCIDGRFGEDCLSYCPANCRYDNCDKISGSCLGGCFSDFSGDQCCLEGPGCQYCASEHICAECIPGKHGSLCDRDCPENCVDSLCHKDTGVCHYVKKPDRIGIIVGGVTGALVFIAMSSAFICFYRRRRYMLLEGSLNAGSRTNQPSNVEFQPNENEEVRRVTNTLKTEGPEQMICDEHLNPAYENLAAADQETEEHNYEDVLGQTSSK